MTPKVIVLLYTPCIPLMELNLLRHRLMQHFTKVGGMENRKLTIMSILQAFMRGCQGRDFVGKQSKDAFSFCYK